MIDNIRNNDVYRTTSAESPDAKKEKPESKASDQDIKQFKKAMEKKNTDSKTGKEGDMSGKTGNISSSGAKETGKTKFDMKQAGEKVAVESSDIKASQETKVKTELFDRTEKAAQNVKQDQQQQTVLKENVVKQVVGKAENLMPNAVPKKDQKMTVGKSQDKETVGGVQNTSVQGQFSAQMASKTDKAAPIDKQALMDQIDKISDYINMQANAMGETQSMTIKFKNDVLPETTLAINKSEDGNFELSFKTTNEDSQNLIAQNQNSLLESLNNNTQGLNFQVKLE
jgi:hypothetical protein